jgi:hypothetical protein
MRMVRNIAFALALTFAASLVMQVMAVSQTAAGPCTYTSSDKKRATSAEVNSMPVRGPPHIIGGLFVSRRCSP